MSNELKTPNLIYRGYIELSGRFDSAWLDDMTSEEFAFRQAALDAIEITELKAKAKLMQEELYEHRTKELEFLFWIESGGVKLQTCDYTVDGLLELQEKVSREGFDFEVPANACAVICTGGYESPTYEEGGSGYWYLNFAHYIDECGVERCADDDEPRNHP